MQDRDIPISGPLLLEKAKFFPDQLEINDFKQSPDWLDRFKERYAISFKTNCGEAKSVDSDSTSIITYWKLSELHAHFVYLFHVTGDRCVFCIHFVLLLIFVFLIFDLYLFCFVLFCFFLPLFCCLFFYCFYLFIGFLYYNFFVLLFFFSDFIFFSFFVVFFSFLRQHNEIALTETFFLLQL